MNLSIQNFGNQITDKTESVLIELASHTGLNTDNLPTKLLAIIVLLGIFWMSLKVTQTAVKVILIVLVVIAGVSILASLL